MPTYLTNDKMSPELRARVEASVGARSHTTRRFAPLLRLGLRATVVLLAVTALGTLATEWRRRHQALDEAKAQLARDLDASWSELEGRPLVRELDRWVVDEAADYRGDLVIPELRGRGGLSQRLAASLVYLRAPLAAVHRDGGLASAAGDSLPDAFVHCLRDPPRGDDEASMLGSLEQAFGDPAAWQTRMASVHRAHELIVGRGFDRDAWTRRLTGAADLHGVGTLRKELERAHLGRATAAAHAETLLLVLDEPKPRDVVSDLDGAHRHHIRVGLVDATTGRALLRWRREVDPSWISKGRRSYFGRSLVACRLALELREHVQRET